MANKISITVTTELTIPKLKEGYEEDDFKKALDKVCWQCECSGIHCKECILDYENFIKLGREK